MPKFKVKSEIATLPMSPSSSQRNAPVVKRQEPIPSEVKIDHDCLTAIKKNSVATKHELPFLNQEINWDDFAVDTTPDKSDPEEDMFAIDPMSFNAL